MNLWIRIDAALPRDENVQKLTERLRVKRAEAVGLLTCLWGAIAEQRPSGDLRGVSHRVLEDWAEFEPRGRVKRGQFALAFMELFTRDGFVRGWRDRQGKLIERAEADRKRKRKEPENSTELPKSSAEPPRNIRGTSAVTERNGTDGTDLTRRDKLQKQKSESGGEIPGDPAAGHDPPPRDRFFANFYAKATAERRADIDRQLKQILRPEGLRVSKTLVVRANSPEHLNRALSDVLRGAPPRNPDRAIVVLFRKLEDAEKNGTGETRPEAAVHDAARQVQLEDRYHAAARNAGAAWATANLPEYDKIVSQLEARYRGQTNSFAQLAKDTERDQKCAKAAGFPDFDTWLEQQPHPVPT